MPDREPPNTHVKVAVETGGPSWDAASIDHFGSPSDIPGRAFILCAVPAFLIGLAITDILSNYGVNEFATFMLTMPPLVAAWFYFVGWLLDRARRIRERAASG
jgi:hypothetical protein